MGLILKTSLVIKGKWNLLAIGVCVGRHRGYTAFQLKLEEWFENNAFS